MTKKSLQQPKALYYLFIVEMWERFSYYGMRAILVLYMTKMLLLGDTKSYLIYGTFTALVYMFPVLGGYLADKYIGYIRAVIIGGCVIIAGHISLALPFTIPILGDKFFFYLGLSFLVVGTGFFKSNVSSIVGTLYNKNDPRRDAGFTIFYMGINLGSFISTIAVAFVADYFGWHCGFSLAAIGMVFGLITFIKGYKDGIFPEIANKMNTNKLTNILIFSGSIIILVISSILISNPGATQSIILVFGALVLLYIIYELIRANNHERAGILMILILSFISMFFFAFFEQAGSSITLFADRNIDRSLFGFNIPSASFVSLNPMFILLLSPFVSKIWLKLSKKNLNPSAIVKFAIGMIGISLGFGALAIGAKISINAVTSSMIWIVLGYFFQTVGELTLSPVGLSAVTKYSPLRMTGLMMGFWFLAAAFADYIAGVLATLTSVDSGSNVSTSDTTGYYTLFSNITVVSFAVGIIVLLSAYWLSKLGKYAEKQNNTAHEIKRYIMNKNISKLNYFSILWALFLIVFVVSCAIITNSYFLRYSLIVWLCIILMLSFLSYRTKKDIEEKTPEKFNIYHMFLFRIFFVIIVLILSFPFVNPPFLNIIERTTTTGVIGFTLTLVGLLFAAISRIILSRNWSAAVVLKKDHELINKGPYALVRHPMYTGVLTAIWGLFMFFGGLVHLIFFIIITYGFIKKMNAEEKVLSENLKGYKEYKEKTKKNNSFSLLKNNYVSYSS